MVRNQRESVVFQILKFVESRLILQHYYTIINSVLLLIFSNNSMMAGNCDHIDKKTLGV